MSDTQQIDVWKSKSDDSVRSEHDRGFMGAKHPTIPQLPHAPQTVCSLRSAHSHVKLPEGALCGFRHALDKLKPWRQQRLVAPRVQDASVQLHCRDQRILCC